MATLKISDLSVGDWVSFDMAHLEIEGDDIALHSLKKVQQPARIKSISGDQDLVFAEVETEDDFGTIYLKMEHIHPIPITAEILEKNGFKKAESQWYMCEINGIRISIVVWESQRGRIEISYKSPFDDDNPLYIADFTANIPHIAVHHLQRVLRLAGVEKEIVL